MQYRHRLPLAAALAVALLAPWAPAVGGLPAPLPVKDATTLLFIANSLVGTSLPPMVEAALASTYDPGARAGDGWQPIRIDCRRLSKWGKGLDTHYQAETYVPEKKNVRPDYLATTPDPSLRAVEAIAAGLDGKPFDLVVLQGWKHDGDKDPAQFLRYVRLFELQIRAAESHPVLMMRHGINPKGREKYARRQMENLVANYNRAGREIGTPVVPLTQIWWDLEHNAPREGLAINWLHGDIVHQNLLGKYVNTYGFFAMLTRRSPVALRFQSPRKRDHKDAPDPELDRAIQQRVWKHIRAREPWAKDPNYNAHQANGSAKATYAPATGRMTLQITGQVIGVRIGAPAARLGQGPMRAVETSIGQVKPDQSDTELTAWFSDNGLASGSYDLGQIAHPDTPAKRIILLYTPAKGPAGVGHIRAE